MSQGEGSDVSGSGSQGAGGEVGLLVLCSDGSVRLVDMQRAKVVMQVCVRVWMRLQSQHTHTHRETHTHTHTHTHALECTHRHRDIHFTVQF